MDHFHIEDDGWILEPTPAYEAPTMNHDIPTPEENEQEEMLSESKDKESLAHNDVVIAVMGMTGAGKSSFISLLTKEDIEIGHNLASCTSEPGVYSYSHMGKTVHLIDTPGFDDTTRSDTDILTDVALLLGTIYAKKVKLAGIIYLHRITDVRMTGSAYKNLQMLGKLWGDGNATQLVLATTMWSALSQQEGEDRQAQLKEKYWKDLEERGCNITRHSGDADSAKNIVSYLLDPDTSVVLDIQREIVDQNMSLDQTSAGRFLQKDLIEARERLEQEVAACQKDLEEAIAEKDNENIALLSKQQQENKAKLDGSKSDQVQLKVNFQDLGQRQDKKYAALARDLEKEKQARFDEIKFIEQNVAFLQDSMERQQREHREQITRITKSQRAKASEDAEKLNFEWSRIHAELAEKIAQQQAELKAVKRKKGKKRGFPANLGAFLHTHWASVFGGDDESEDSEPYSRAQRSHNWS